MDPLPSHVSKLEMKQSGVHAYRVYSPEEFDPSAWMTTSHSFSRFGGYVTSFPFNIGPVDDLLSQGALAVQSAETGISSDLYTTVYNLRKIPPLSEPKELSLSLPQCAHQQDDEGYVTPVTDIVLSDPQINELNDPYDPTEVWSDALKVELPQMHSWETLGMDVFSNPEKPFISAASPEAHVHLATLADLYYCVQQGIPIAKPVSISRGVFLRDALYLLDGVQSSNFLYDKENNCFIIRSGLCLQGYTVSTTKTLCEDFLFCGTYFRRLEEFSNYQSTQLENGFVLKALKKSIQQWTHFYHGVVLVLSAWFSTPDSPISLFELLERVRVLKCQVECLARLSHVLGPDHLPSGVALLAHIYQEASMSSPQLSHLLYFVLRSCCMVYLRCLEQWIFRGHCSDRQFEEFFVYPNGNFCGQRNRSYWTRGFMLNRGNVPDFLKGLENAIFDCGRAINLLLLCKPNHPLCCLLKHKHPTLRCCLFKTDLETVNKECAEFEFEVLQKCGEQFSILKLLEEEKKQEAYLQILVLKIQDDRAIAQASLKEQQVRVLLEKKRKQHEDLKAQMEAVREKKAAEQKQQQLEDQQYLEEHRHAEEILQKRQETERQKLLAYYESLNKIVQKQEDHAEWQTKRLKLAEKRQKFFLKTQVLESEEHKALDIIDKCFGFGCKVISSVELADIPEIPVLDSLTFENLNTAQSQVLVPVENKHEEVSISTKDSVQGVLVAEPQGTAQGQEPQLGSQIQISTDRQSHLMASTAVLGFSGTCDRDRNRKKILDSQFTFSDAVSAKPYIDFASYESDIEKNRRRVLTEDYNSFLDAAPAKPHIDDATYESDLEKNRRKVLREEYNILTGELKLENTVSSVCSLKAECSPSPSLKQDDIDQNLCTHSKPNEEDIDSKLPAFRQTHMRPQSLRLESACSGSPSVTPASTSDVREFGNPFEGTNRLPHELVLTSPLKSKDISVDLESSQVEEFPVMFDIMDSFAEKLGVSAVDDDAKRSDRLVTTEITSEPISSLPNTAWLESSLQKCLLIPLRVQHKFVSAALLQYFLVDLKLLHHLRSLRSYYFMLDGEFSRYLTVKLFTKMYQVKAPQELLNLVSLNNLLREALANSQGSADPNHSHLSLFVTQVPDHFSHHSANVLDCLHLIYDVPWPLNVLLTEEAIKKYNMVFLFLVRLRRVAWLLQEDFVVLKKTANSCRKGATGDLTNSPQYHQVQMIRHAMSQFVQATLNYISSSVLHASWTDFEESLKQAKTIDNIYLAHITYVKQILKRCLLNENSKRVEAVLSKIIIYILQFHTQLRVRPWQYANKSTVMRSSKDHLEHPNFLNIQSCFKHFKVCRLLSYLERLIAPPNHRQHLAGYVLLLNINGFYQSSEYLQLAESTN